MLDGGSSPAGEGRKVCDPLLKLLTTPLFENPWFRDVFRPTAALPLLAVSYQYSAGQEQRTFLVLFNISGWWPLTAKRFSQLLPFKFPGKNQGVQESPLFVISAGGYAKLISMCFQRLK